MQREQFIQQQYMQMAINGNQKAQYALGFLWPTGSTISKKGMDRLDALFTYEQKKEIEKMMAETKEKEARDAELKAANEANKWFWQ